MTSNNTGENGTLVTFSPNSIFISSTSLTRSPTISTNTNNAYESLIANMLDAELDSDPQMSDSELSWQSVTDVDSLTATNHWRGWKQQSTTSSITIINSQNSLPLTNTVSMCNSSLASSNEGLIENNLRVNVLDLLFFYNASPHWSIWQRKPLLDTYHSN